MKYIPSEFSMKNVEPTVASNIFFIKAQILTWKRGVSIQAVITGIHPNGSCAFSNMVINQ
jgi:hypothetical protein